MTRVRTCVCVCVLVNVCGIYDVRIKGEVVTSVYIERREGEFYAAEDEEEEQQLEEGEGAHSSSAWEHLYDQIQERTAKTDHVVLYTCA